MCAPSGNLRKAGRACRASPVTLADAMPAMEFAVY